MAPISFLILAIYVFSIFILVTLERDFSLLLIFSKNQLLVSCRQHIVGYYFLKIHTDHLSLLIDIFRQFTFKIITDIVRFISNIFVTVFYSMSLFLVSILSSITFLYSLVLIELFTMIQFFSSLNISVVLKIFLLVALEFAIYIYNKSKSTFK